MQDCAVTFGSTKNFYCCRSCALLCASLPLEVLRISTVVDQLVFYSIPTPLEVLRISTVVDTPYVRAAAEPLEVLRISTVVDCNKITLPRGAFGSTKNFYCCRFCSQTWEIVTFGSTKNFYCCRFHYPPPFPVPLEVLRISTVVDAFQRVHHAGLWKY